MATRVPKSFSVRSARIGGMAKRPAVTAKNGANPKSLQVYNARNRKAQKPPKVTKAMAMLQQGKHRDPARNAIRAGIRAGDIVKVKGKPNIYLLKHKKYADAAGLKTTKAGLKKGYEVYYHDDHTEK